MISDMNFVLTAKQKEIGNFHYFHKKNQKKNQIYKNKKNSS